LSPLEDDMIKVQQTFDKPPPSTPEKEPAPPGISAQDDSTPPGNF